MVAKCLRMKWEPGEFHLTPSCSSTERGWRGTLDHARIYGAFAEDRGDGWAEIKRYAKFHLYAELEGIGEVDILVTRFFRSRVGVLGAKRRRAIAEFMPAEIRLQEPGPQSKWYEACEEDLQAWWERVQQKYTF